jgi:protein-tyrosine phosphatase
MEGFVDIHSHILPSIDDGSKSMEKTLAMLKIAVSEGIKTIIATPHYHEGRMKNFCHDIEENYNIVIENLNAQKCKINILPGCEIYYTHDTVKLLNDRKIPTLANSKYVLLEFSVLAEGQYINNALQEIILEGYLPIIAHIERYEKINQNLDFISDLIEMGSYVQINAASVTGEFGLRYKEVSKKLLKNNLVHIIASDAHSDHHRAPKLQNCAKYISKKFGEAYAREIMIDNPGKVICNEYI